MLATVIAIGVLGHSTVEPSPVSTTRPSGVGVAVAAPASPAPSTGSLIVPVDRINKFIIDDNVRGGGLRVVTRARVMNVPRAI